MNTESQLAQQKAGFRRIKRLKAIYHSKLTKRNMPKIYGYQQHAGPMIPLRPNF